VLWHLGGKNLSIFGGARIAGEQCGLCLEEIAFDDGGTIANAKTISRPFIEFPSQDFLGNPFLTEARDAVLEEGKRGRVGVEETRFELLALVEEEENIAQGAVGRPCYGEPVTSLEKSVV